jgi:hypothetical protein
VLTGAAQEKARKPLRAKKSSQKAAMPQSSPFTRASSTSCRNEGDKNDDYQILQGAVRRSEEGGLNHSQHELRYFRGRRNGIAGEKAAPCVNGRIDDCLVSLKNLNFPDDSLFIPYSFLGIVTEYFKNITVGYEIRGFNTAVQMNPIFAF